MGSYDELESNIDKMIKYAIHADMTQSNWIGPAGGPYSYVRAEYDVVKVPGPGGEPTGSVVIGTRCTYGDVSQNVSVNPTEDIYKPWDTKLRALFDGWTASSFPDPKGFKDGINTLARAAAHLNGDGAQLDDKGLATNPELGDFGRATGLLDPMAGDTVGEFSRKYMHRLPANIGAQCQAAIDLTEGALGEQNIFIQGRDSVGEIADKGANAMKAIVEGDIKGGVEAVLTVVGTALAITSIYAPPSWAVTLGWASVGNGLLEKGASLIKEKKPVKLGGDSASAVYGNIEQALTELSGQIKTEEELLSKEFTRITTDITGGGEAWNVEPPASMGTATHEGAYGHVTRVQSDRLTEVGDILLPNIAQQFSKAADLLDPGVSQHEWWRVSTIGMGAAGPYYDLQDACIALATVLLDNKQELIDAGEQLLIAADFFDKTDTEVQGRLRDHLKSVNPDQTPEVPWNQPPPAPGKPLPTPY